MKKLTKRSLDELAKEMPILSEELQRSFVGGGNGTKDSPYTEAEYDIFLNSGYFPGGYVDFGGTNSPYYLGAAKGETTTSGNYTNNKDANQMMYDCGYAEGYKSGLNDDSFMDYFKSGLVYLSTVLTTGYLREIELDVHRTYYSTGFAAGYQKGVSSRP